MRNLPFHFPDICLRSLGKRPHYTDQATIQVASLLQSIALATFATPKTAEPEPVVAVAVAEVEAAEAEAEAKQKPVVGLVVGLALVLALAPEKPPSDPQP